MRAVREGLTSRSLEIALEAAVHGAQAPHVWLKNDLPCAKARRRRPDDTSKFSPDHADPPGSPMAEEDPEEWVASENFVCHYYPAILDNEDGTERSLWPQKWPLSYLEEHRHERSFRKNMMNDPMAVDGEYWTDEDFTYGCPSPLTHQLLSIDPAVTSKKKSDFTALAVIGCSKPQSACVVRWARTFKVSPGEQLRAIVLRTLETWPDVHGVLIETNQGGDTWRAILHGLPVPIQTVHQSEPKEVRAARLLNHYQRRRVVHEQKLPHAEQQMVAFPKGTNDDLVDAIGSGVEVFLGKKRHVQVASRSYVA